MIARSESDRLHVSKHRRPLPAQDFPDYWRDDRGLLCLTAVDLCSWRCPGDFVPRSRVLFPDSDVFACIEAHCAGRCLSFGIALLHTRPCGGMPRR